MSSVFVTVSEEAPNPFEVPVRNTDASIIDTVDNLSTAFIGGRIAAQRQYLLEIVHLYQDILKTPEERYGLFLQPDIFFRSLSNGLIAQFRRESIVTHNLINRRTVLLGRHPDRYWDLRDVIWSGFDSSIRDQEAKYSIDHEEYHAQAAEHEGWIWSYGITFTTLIMDSGVFTDIAPEVVYAPPATMDSRDVFCRAAIAISQAVPEQSDGDSRSITFFEAVRNGHNRFLIDISEASLRTIQIKSPDHGYAKILERIFNDPQIDIAPVKGL